MYHTPYYTITCPGRQKQPKKIPPGQITREYVKTVCLAVFLFLVYTVFINRKRGTTMYIDTVTGGTSYKDGKYTSVYRFPVDLSNGQQEFTDLNAVCGAVKETELPGAHFHEVGATWTKYMNYRTNLMEKALEVRIVSDSELPISHSGDVMEKLDDLMQEHMKGYPEWDRAAEGPKPPHACVHYGLENAADDGQDFADAVSSISTDDKGLKR